MPYCGNTSRAHQRSARSAGRLPPASRADRSSQRGGIRRAGRSVVAAGGRGLLGAVVRAVPDGRAGARAGRRRQRRPLPRRQGEHRRGARARRSLPHPVDSDDGGVRRRPGERARPARGRRPRSRRSSAAMAKAQPWIVRAFAVAVRHRGVHRRGRRQSSDSSAERFPLARGSGVHRTPPQTRRARSLRHRASFRLRSRRRAPRSTPQDVDTPKNRARTLRLTFAATCARGCRTSPNRATETTPGVDAPARPRPMTSSLRRATASSPRGDRASLTPDERREILRGMVLTRADRQSPEGVLHRRRGALRRRRRSRARASARSARRRSTPPAIRLRRGDAYRDADGDWRGDVVAPIIRDLGVSAGDAARRRRRSAWC